MKKTIVLSIFSILLTSFAIISIPYDPAHVDISSVTDKNGYTYQVVNMNKTASTGRIKTKYFAAKSDDGITVYDRYKEWVRGKDVIAVSSAGYMTGYEAGKPGTPVGLTIDNGTIVNGTIQNFDGLIIVYATGGIAASNLKDADLKLQGGGIDPNRRFDIKNNIKDKYDFINWAKTESATVFQTHLLVYRDIYQVALNAPSEPKTRRFFAVGNDKNTNELYYVIVNCPEATSLYQGGKRVKEFLNNYNDLKIVFMINLDTGDQDIFKLYNRDGSVNNLIRPNAFWEKPLSAAANLLAFYYH